MIFLHGLALAVYEVQRYLKYRDDQRLEMLNAMEAERLAAEKAKVAAAVADAEYAAWKEALIAAALEAERVSAYLRKNAGTPAALEAHRLAAAATKKGHSAAAALEAERVAAAVAMEKALAAAALDAEKVSAAAANLSNDKDVAGAVAASKVKTVPVKQNKSKKRGMFGGMKTGFML
ncbi:tol-Pal system protein TolA-like [Haliotis cracherodii]|uniref:tol-Pal system protein TolA-like n=1 Tax=Haliotis cracherodii TaxID=6455 RepID=UPI0039EA80ED